MPWRPGQSGNPAGRRNEALFRSCLLLALNEPHGPKRIPKLRVIADKLVAEAIKGEQWAIQEIGNRLDGRPTERVSMEHDESATMLELLRAVGRGEFVGRNITVTPRLIEAQGNQEAD